MFDCLFSDYLVDTLTKHGYVVDVFRDLKETDLRQVIDHYSDLDYSDFDTFILAISSHGRLVEITCTDERHVKLQDIVNRIAGSAGLRGKPKSIWVQACQQPPSS